MVLDWLVNVVGVYWPFLLAALVIGLATGWLSYDQRSDRP